MAATHLEIITRYFRDIPSLNSDRFIAAHEAAVFLQSTLESRIPADHPYRPFLKFLAVRYRALAQDLIAKRGYGYLEAYNLYEDAVTTIAGLYHTTVDFDPNVPRIADWRLPTAAIVQNLAAQSRQRTASRLKAIQHQEVIEGNILNRARIQLAHVAQVLYDDFPTHTAHRIAFIEFTIDAERVLAANPAPP